MRQPEQQQLHRPRSQKQSDKQLHNHLSSGGGKESESCSCLTASSRIGIAVRTIPAVGVQVVHCVCVWCRLKRSATVSSAHS